MPSLRRSVGLALAMLLALPAAAHARSGGCRTDAPPAAAALDEAASAVVCEVNAARRARGLAALAERPRLARAGSRFAALMVARGFFAHVGPDGATVGDRLRAAGYVDARDRWVAGEMLAWGWGSQATPAATVREWLASPPHRRLLLSRDFRHIGVGVARGAPLPHPFAVAATYAAELASRR
jgi:uncharacterized protein YkwD